MAKYVFFAQSLIDGWSEGEKISIENNVLTLKRGKQLSRFVLEEAFRFVKVAGGDVDPNGWIGKIKTKRQLEELGAEAYLNSVIYGDTAYDVEEGYLGRGETVDLSAAAKQPPPPPPRPKPVEAIQAEQVPAKDETSDEELLTQFLLKNLP